MYIIVIEYIAINIYNMMYIFYKRQQYIVLFCNKVLKNVRRCGIMQEKVVIFMNNSNALISMALVSQNAENPFHAFCEYIKYCVTVNGDGKVLISDIRESVEKEFGIRLPRNIIKICLEYLSDEGFVKQVNESIKITGDYNAKEFDNERKNYKETEDKLISALIDYASGKGRSWDKEYAKTQLIKVLDANGLAFDIFSRKNITNGQEEADSIIAEINSLNSDNEEEADNSSEQSAEDNTEEPIFSDENITGRFVKKILEEKSLLTDYLVKVCEGLMICVGTYQLPSNGIRVKGPNIKGTNFFFDTRLLLRVIGCANSATVEASRELVKMIQQNGGLIYYYPHTYSEMQNAFDDAIRQYSNKDEIKDDEMRRYTNTLKNPLSILRLKKANLKDELLSYEINLMPLGSFDDSDRIRFNFDTADMTSFIQSEFHWKNYETIENDVSSIWETHMRRNADYTDCCGGTSKLPIFVTTNVKLPLIALVFSKKRPNTRSISQWKKNRLPVITDVKLTSRLWVPSEQAERVSLLHLTANTVAALRPTKAYINKVREYVGELVKEAPKYSNVSLSEYFSDNIIDSVFEKAEGKDDNFQLSTLAETIEEELLFKDEQHAKEMNSIKSQHKKEMSDINKQLDLQSFAYDELKNGVIESAVDRNRTNKSISKFRMFVLLYHGLFISAIFAIIGIVLTFVINEWRPLIGIGVFILLWIGEHFIPSYYFKKKIIIWLYPKLKEKYKNEIQSNLTGVEIGYSNEIIDKVLAESKYINKIEDLIKEDK